MKFNGILLLTLFSIVCSCKTQTLAEAETRNNDQLGSSVKFINGYWFNGRDFDAKKVWMKNGILSFRKIAVDTTIDLSGKYIIPPFAEAHNHNLESDYKLQERIESYLKNGVFYVKLLSSIKKRIAPLMHHYNKPDGLDISMAHAPLTATDGHPIGVRKRYLERGHFDGLFSTLEELESHGYFTIDNVDDLEQKWEQILFFSPDFIKINLLYSEEYEERKDFFSFFARKGLDPKLVPKIVAKAHQNNRRVSAHVETAYDFHVVVEAGVDEIAHLPEISHGKPIERKDAALAKEKGTIVVTTTSLVKKKELSPNYEDLIKNISSNLQILKEEGVTLAIGSDMYNDNSVGEFEFLYGLGIFSNLELLKMWCENAVITTFPNRKIGYLRNGYEASFLVLDKNPIEDISSINKAISLRVKQGVLLK